MTRCYLGLGSNLGDSVAQLRFAWAALEGTTDYSNLRRSSIFRSAPIGPGPQAAYLNAVIGLDTDRSPHALLDHLQALEHAAGRERSVRWGPRTLDLDVLLFGDLLMTDDRLSVPHPRMLERNFVLEPLAELAGSDLLIPNGRGLKWHLCRCPPNPLERTEIPWEPEETGDAAKPRGAGHHEVIPG